MEELEWLSQSEGLLIGSNPCGTLGDDSVAVLEQRDPSRSAESFYEPRPNRRHLDHAAGRETELNCLGRYPDVLEQVINRSQPLVDEVARVSLDILASQPVLEDPRLTFFVCIVGNEDLRG